MIYPPYTILRQMAVNDRMCIALQGKREPYNIVRVLDVSGNLVTVYFSLLKKQFRLHPYNEVSITLLDHPVTVSAVHDGTGGAIVRFTAKPPVEFRPLKARESYRAEDSLRDGTDMQREKHLPASGSEQERQGGPG